MRLCWGGGGNSTAMIPGGSIGNCSLIDPGVCFYGEVSSAELISGNELASKVSLTAGTAFNSDVGWLKFKLDDKFLYVAKKPFRYNLNWQAIHAAKIAASLPMKIGKMNYLCRLLRTDTPGFPSGIRLGSGVAAHDIAGARGSEYNRLFYHIAKNVNAGNPTSTGIVTGDLSQYTNDDLGWSPSTTVHISGTLTLTVNSGSADSTVKLGRGQANASYIQGIDQNITHPHIGWRPVLELIE